MLHNNKMYDLTEKADKYLNLNKSVPNDLIDEIKKFISNSDYIGLAQINNIAGDLEYNAKKIKNYIKYAEAIGLNSIIFPELALLGYPLEDTVRRHPVLVTENIKWLNALAKITNNTIAFVGFLEPSEIKDVYYNSIAVLHHGIIQGVFRKCTLDKFSNTNDIKYQKVSPVSGFISTENLIKGEYTQTKLYENYKITIGSDLYNEQNMYEDKPNIIINCSALPCKYSKELIDRNQLSTLAAKFKTPIVFVNQTGTTDCHSFDGLSCAYNDKGELIARANAYEEQLLIVNPKEGIGEIYPIPQGYMASPQEFSLDYEYDMERLYKVLIQGIQDYFNKCGIKRAVLGLSGGLDSTVCAVLLADAIGKENVLGISMPSKITSDESKSDAEQLAANLGINFTEMPIRTMVDTAKECFDTLFKNVESKWNYRYKTSFTNDNIQARTRATYLWGIANEFDSCIPIATSDKSEAYMGYATINGDMSGGFAPIADVTKTKLFALARWLNKNREQKNAIPESIILKRPGAELAIDPKTGKPLAAEDALMPYEFLDEIIWRIENKHEGYNELLNSKFVYETHNNLSKEQKQEWVDKFYKRMSRAFYKWSIMPPSTMAEFHSINSSDYKQPITSCRINYQGTDDNNIGKVLDN